MKPKRGRGRPGPTWKDWAGRLPADYMGAERTNLRRAALSRVIHIMFAPWGAPCCTWDMPEPGEMMTLCGVEVRAHQDIESWTTEAMKEESPTSVPFPDDRKVCRICNARIRKINDEILNRGESPTTKKGN